MSHSLKKKRESFDSLFYVCYLNAQLDHLVICKKNDRQVSAPNCYEYDKTTGPQESQEVKLFRKEHGKEEHEKLGKDSWPNH